MMITDLVSVNLWTVTVIILPILYFIYYRKFRVFIYDQPEKVTKGKIIRGKCPPAYPNGWFWLIDSENLSRGDVKFIQHCGRDVVLFRGHDGKPYVLDAYCAHIGGNLGVGGKVRDINCIECPFHGWIYDGETGACVFSDGENKIPRKVDTFEYIDVERCTASNAENESDYLQKIAENQEVKLKRYECREMNGSIFAWFHADEQLRNKPLYELFDIKDEIKRNNMEGKNKIFFRDWKIYF
jgi:cholesterol 7-dehydrogenase